MRSIVPREFVTHAALGMLAFAGALALAGFSQSPFAQGGQPPGTPGPASRGRAVYEQHCVECHGADGKGSGPAAAALMPRPRDFSVARYKVRSTETGSLPTDADLLRSIREGLPGSSMPAWGPLLAADDINAVAEYIKAFSPRFGAEAPEVITLSATIARTTPNAARGAEVYQTLKCGMCHGTDGRGTGATATSFEDDAGFPLRAADLTEPWTFRGGASAADISMRFRAGMSGTPMPSYKDAASDEDMWHLANYVVSLRRTPVWEMNADQVTAHYRRLDEEARANPVKRGEYLANAMGCPLCHTPVDEQKRAIPGFRMAGGMRMDLAPFGTYYAGNLTSDHETGLGAWTDEEIARAVTKGIRRDGTRMLPFPMDWASYSTMSAPDLNAIVTYLRTIPPVRNMIPPPKDALLPVLLWGKFKMLIRGDDLPSHLYSGNAGVTTGGQR